MSSADSSSDLSENDIVQNLDDTAQAITNNLLPEKFKARYNLCYDEFLLWKEKNKAHSLEESIFLVYFNELSKIQKSSTLWSRWSMLRITINLRHGVDIGRYHKLKMLIKNCAKGYHPKKAQVLTFKQITTFLNDSDDLNHLAEKVILIFGVFGAMRIIELCNLDIQNVEDTGSQFIVTIRDNKNYYPRNFIIGQEYYGTVKKYISLRSDDLATTRFFLGYKKGKCTRQVIGKNKFSEVPKTVADYLQLENPKAYTGHCFRRTAATLLANSGANLTAVKQLGGWRSSTVAKGYIEHSLANRRQIYHQMISSDQEFASTSTIYAVPSTSTVNQVLSTSTSNQILPASAINPTSSTSTTNQILPTSVINPAPSTSTDNQASLSTTNKNLFTSITDQVQSTSTNENNNDFVWSDSDDESDFDNILKHQENVSPLQTTEFNSSGASKHIKRKERIPCKSSQKINSNTTEKWKEIQNNSESASKRKKWKIDREPPTATHIKK